ncbi:MAG: response regulator [Polyangiaceae bacterium]
MRMLLVEDDVGLGEAIMAAARDWTLERGGEGIEAHFDEVLAVSTLQDGIAKLDSESFDLVVTDVALGEHSGLTLVRHAMSLVASPVIVAISGEATAAQAFALSELGVRGYLAKPFDLRELRGTIQAVLSRPPEVALRASAQVGHRPIHAVQDEVKLAMLRRALHEESGNISRAARRLGITRAGVQQMIDRFELPRNKRGSNTN